jgi:hypothetical protein
MRGITIDELKDKLLHGHEVEFTYLDCEYSIESELIDGNNKVQIWKCAENDADCIASMTISKDEEIEDLFKHACFSGKSFYDIENEVIVEAVF